MNVTTKKSECDPKLRIRQLEVAIEHALAAATASHSNSAVQTTASYRKVEISYPSFEFRETLKKLRPNAGFDGIWIVIDLGGAATVEASKAAPVPSSTTTTLTRCSSSARFQSPSPASH